MRAAVLAKHHGRYAAPSSLTVAQQIAAALGGDANVGGIFLDTVNLSTSGGNVTSWQDARGGSFPTMTPTGTIAYTAGTGLTFTGTQYLSCASALITGTDNWAMIVVRQAEWTTSDGNQILAGVGNGSSDGFFITTSTASGGPSNGGMSNVLGGIFGGLAWIGSDQRIFVEFSDDAINGVVPANSNRIDHTFRRLAGTTTTREQGVVFGGAATTVPNAPSAISYIGWNGAHDKFKGIIRAVIFVKADPGGSALDNAEVIVRGACGVAERFTTITLPTSWTTIAQVAGGGSSFGDWTPSAAVEGGLPAIDNAPPSPGVAPMVKYHYLNTTGSAQDRNATILNVPATPINNGYVTKLTGTVLFDPAIDYSADQTGRKYLYFQSYVAGSKTLWCIVGSYGNVLNISYGHDGDGGYNPLGPNLSTVTFNGSTQLDYELVVAMETAFAKYDGYVHLKIGGVLVHRDFNAHFSMANYAGVINPTTQQVWGRIEVGDQVNGSGNFDELRWMKNPKIEIGARP